MSLTRIPLHVPTPWHTLRARAVLACTALICTTFTQAASVAPVAAENGMVVSAQHLATQVGVDVLKRGGTAVDAAVAVGYALAVVYPAAGNLGGGGFMTIQLADGRKTFIDFREKAPLGAKRDMFLDAQGKVIPKLSTHGYLAAGVPGTVAGLEYTREKYGRLSRAELIAPSIALAEKGFVLDDGDVALLGEGTQDFLKDSPTAGIYLNKGKPFESGQRLVQKDLAKTLRLISKNGVDGFYKGPVARAMVQASQQGGGLFTTADFEQYKPRELAPIECDYRGYHIVSAPPPSSGGIVVCEVLNILSGYPMKELGFRSAQAVHYQIEALRHAYVDRNSYLGDPEFVKNPIDRLLDAQYAEKIRQAIDPDKAGISQDIKPGVAPHEGSNTTHYSVADRWGNAVAVTYTLNDWFGARVTVPGTGVLLNNEMDDFTAKVGVPNMYGLIQGEANAIEPGKRPLSSMTPTIVSIKGQPAMVVGTPGGSRIITAVLHTIWNAVDYDMNIQEAVDAPRFHQQWMPEFTNLEKFAVSPDTQKLLEAKGHKFGPPQPANHVAALMIGAPTLEGKIQGKYRFFGANDPRRNTGLAKGY